MHFTKEEEGKFSRLGIDSLLELALLIPSSYEDYRLHSQLFPQKPQLIDATVSAIYQGANSLQITFFVHNFGYTIAGVLFRPKPYMIHQFQVGNRAYYYGVIDCQKGTCSMRMPKRVVDIGKITPKYKYGIRNDAMRRLVATLLTKENLLNEGLPHNVVRGVLALHFPTQGMDTSQINPESLYALKYIELFLHMKSLAKRRRYFDALSSNARDYRVWAKRLPFRLTQEQCQTIEAIGEDFRKSIAGKRMIVGDVGSGKTMVILASAYMIFPQRSILMAPTTILAKQLFEEAEKFLPDVKITLVTNGTKEEDLSRYDLIIGTHAVLFRELPEASLVMVDEQHRFGTKQRNMLEKLVSRGAKRPHYLQFSATPIPRTQAMIESAYVDVSLITSTPFVKDIDSNVIGRSDFPSLLLHIREEIAKGNQVLIVYPLVNESEALEYQSIEEARGYWERNFPNLYVTHGKDREKEKVLQEFRERGDILIATTVVEVGISLPRLSTVVIVGAERLGLATLHQLRGRVSRTGLKGYCYLYTNKPKSKRLEAFVRTTSGFEIANLDLKFRKSGDLLQGLSQSGTQFKWCDFAEDEAIVKNVQRNLLWQKQ